jgi:hypothetical protein
METKNTPQIQTVTTITLPGRVLGKKSPYPTIIVQQNQEQELPVVIVTMIHQQAL